MNGEITILRAINMHVNRANVDTRFVQKVSGLTTVHEVDKA